MGKLLFWIAVILVVLFAVRLINHQKSKASQANDAKDKPAEKPTLGKAEEMVRCNHCGVYMPRSEALLKQGEFWCSEEHARLGAKDR